MKMGQIASNMRPQEYYICVKFLASLILAGFPGPRAFMAP